MIKNIIFDMGGVLVDLRGKRCLEAFENIGAPEVAVYVRECKTKDLFLDIELGRISNEAFCDEVRRISPSCKATDEEIYATWNTLLDPMPEEKSQRLLALKAQGYHLFLLSNTNDIHWQYAISSLIPKDGLTIDDYFERSFVSHEMGIRKPEHRIFEEVLLQAGLKAEETMFIDDNLANVTAAAEAGITPFHEKDGHRWMDSLPGAFNKEEAVTFDSVNYCATIGFFDGVHKGHQYMIERLKDEAKTNSLSSMVITFRQHPRQVLQQDFIPKLITPCDEKLALLRQTGVDRVVALDFTPELAKLSAREFMLLLYNKIGVRRLLIGYDNRFGHNRSEGFEDYQRHGREIGIEVISNDAYCQGNGNTSSSMVRRLLAEGDISEANRCLGREFGFSGLIVHGLGEGRKIGYPTANMQLSPEQLIPKRGVYAVRVEIEGYNTRFAGMMNIGCRPTYGEFEQTIEVNILDFDADIYDKRITISIVDRLRDEKRFDSIADLKKQLAKDKDEIKGLKITD